MQCVKTGRAFTAIGALVGSVGRRSWVRMRAEYYTSQLSEARAARNPLSALPSFLPFLFCTSDPRAPSPERGFASRRIRKASVRASTERKAFSRAVVPARISFTPGARDCRISQRNECIIYRRLDLWHFLED